MIRRRLDNRQLAFARAIAEGKSGEDAQRIAGYQPNRGQELSICFGGSTGWGKPAQLRISGNLFFLEMSHEADRT